MKGTDAQFIEAIRLIRNFFPEAKGYLSEESGLSLWMVIEAMSLGDFKKDYSCEPYGVPPGPDLGLYKRGGFDDENDIVFKRLLEHTGFSPSGRVVVVPDAIGKTGWSKADLCPFVCDHKRIFERLAEKDYLFNGTNDSIFVFESGECMAVDHDNRFYWSKSKIRQNSHSH